MAFGQVVFLFLNYCLVVLVAGQGELDKDVEIIPGKTVPQPLDAKFAPQYANDVYGPPGPEPNWKAWAMLWADEGDDRNGEVNFRQVSPVQPVLANINATGLPRGRHAVHIHAYGDMRDRCRSTGPHVRGVLIGNIDVPESGTLDLSFFSSHIQLFGSRGIIGRAIVIHERPIEFTRSPNIYGVPVADQSSIQPVSYQTEEMSVGGVLACTVYSACSIVQDMPQNV